MPGSRSVRPAAVLLAAALALLPACSTPVNGSPSAASAAPSAGPPDPTSAAPAGPVATPAESVPGPRAQPGDVFDDPQGRFDLLPPEGWEVDTTGTQGAAAVFLDPQSVSTPSGPFRPNINVQVGPSPGDLDFLLEQSRRELATLTAYSSTTDEPLTLADGTPAHLIGGTFTDDASGLELQNLQLFAIDAGDDVVVVTATAPRSAWGDYAEQLDASVRTLTFAG